MCDPIAVAPVFTNRLIASFGIPSTMAIVVSDVWLRTAYDAIPARNKNSASILTPQTPHPPQTVSYS